MAPASSGALSVTAEGSHFSCSMTAVLLARVAAHGGERAVGGLLEAAGSTRPPDYLLDTGNWISYDEAVALWRAGAMVTHHPQFARAVGEDTVRRLGASPVASLLRSLGGPEHVFSHIAASGAKFSSVTTLEAIRTGAGFADIVAKPAKGFPRSAEHCAWTCGLFTQPPVLFGLAPAVVEHEQCAAFGAAECDYRVVWEPQQVTADRQEPEALAPLQRQLDAMHERLRSMFATAADLISPDEIRVVLGRIVDRAAAEVRAPRYLLAVRLNGRVHTHHKGLDERQVDSYVHRILEQDPSSLPAHWLTSAVRSSRQDYGWLVAIYGEDQSFFPQEHELLDVYARYAATALDNANALIETRDRYAQSSALLDLARALAAAGTTGEVARRLADAVPAVVDCDRVDVYLWNEVRGELIRAASSCNDGDEDHSEPSAWSPSPGGLLERLLSDPQPEPVLISGETVDPDLKDLRDCTGADQMMLVPLTTPESLLGLLSVWIVGDQPLLVPSPDLLDRLSGVAAQASTALQNGHLVDQITFQALHDELTGLANRHQFADALRGSIIRARTRSALVSLFYVDLDGFKPVNDEHGHDAGDELLVQVARRLAACVRGEDTVARIGGDEFAVLLDVHVAPQASDAVSQRLAKAFAQPFVIGGRRIMLHASIGQAQFPRDADNAEGLRRTADAAMFAVKREHQGRTLVAEAR
jgi:diguanylate cyclase (GGDEF)-like protein